MMKFLINSNLQIKMHIKKFIFILFVFLLIQNCSTSNNSFYNTEIQTYEASSISSSTASYAGSPEAAILLGAFELFHLLNFNLDSKEINLHNESLFVALNHLENGEIISWHNKDRHSSGKIRIVATYYRDKDYCRIIQSYVKLNDAEKHETKNICKNSIQFWRTL